MGLSSLWGVAEVSVRNVDHSLYIIAQPMDVTLWKKTWKLSKRRWTTIWTWMNRQRLQLRWPFKVKFCKGLVLHPSSRMKFILWLQFSPKGGCNSSYIHVLLDGLWRLFMHYWPTFEDYLWCAFIKYSCHIGTFEYPTLVVKEGGGIDSATKVTLFRLNSTLFQCN